MTEYGVFRLFTNTSNIKNARILLLGLAYKKDVDDLRESPSLRLIELLEKKGAIVDYNDPYIPKVPKTRRHRIEKHSVELTTENVSRYDCVVIATDHTNYDAEFISGHAQLIVDTRNLIKDRNNPKIKRA